LASFGSASVESIDADRMEGGTGNNINRCSQNARSSQPVLPCSFLLYLMYKYRILPCTRAGLQETDGEARGDEEEWQRSSRSAGFSPSPRRPPKGVNLILTEPVCTARYGVTTRQQQEHLYFNNMPCVEQARQCMWSRAPSHRTYFASKLSSTHSGNKITGHGSHTGGRAYGAQ
jgi:hypothetical protein